MVTVVPRLLTRRVFVTHSLVGLSKPFVGPLAAFINPWRRRVRREAAMQHQHEQQQLQQQANSILGE